MSVADWLLDTSLAVALPLVAWRVLTTDDLSKAVVLFIALGLLSALAWARTRVTVCASCSCWAPGAKRSPTGSGDFPMLRS